MSSFAACGGESDSEPQNTRQLIEQACEKMSGAPCGSPTRAEECLAELRQQRADAEIFGCQSALDTYLSCAEQEPIECSLFEGAEPRPSFGSACSEKGNTFQECVTGVGPECGIGFGPVPNGVTCGVSCASFSSMCQGLSQTGPLECVCQTGPHAGTNFQATDCSRGVIMGTGHTCR